MDAFEPAYPVQQQKARYIIMMCTAMHFVAIACTWVGPLNTTGTDPGHRVIDFLQSLVDASASSQVDSHGQSNFFCARCENTQRTNTPFSSVPVRPRVLIYVLPWSCHTWVPCPLHVFHTRSVSRVFADDWCWLCCHSARSPSSNRCCRVIDWCMQTNNEKIEK